ncbi:HIT family protein [Candidatus Nanohalobium constans]|uniref:Histidine triad (HIT) family protein n=1 Tax=Candidatus Nanohalobium constans TaxID=2565781 RepID=A0A5Q0UFR9_9ARCH|nr:HIT family protein [Candidatus Nanohalobium constans]QGA80473.1 histidine triad (HIT) family protein [Candidatus Nanohalobium constans]
MPPGQGDQCPFCQLIENPQQLITVGETENFYAWLEVQPRSKGHANVVPKDHKESILEFSPEEYHEAMTLVRETIDKAIDGLGADGASITMNVKEAGGQMLPHAYIQIFPRFEEDENAGTPTGAIFQHREDLQDQDKLKEIQGEMNSVSPNFETEKIEPHPESQRFKEEPEEKQEENVENSEESGEEEEDDGRPERGESIEWM